METKMPNHVSGPSWRFVYLCMFLALFVVSAWMATELRRGVGYGESLIALQRQQSAAQDSLALGVELARNAASSAESNSILIRGAVVEIKSAVDRNGRLVRKLARANAQRLSAKIDSVKATVDSVQMEQER
jgi:hypothetical protein